MEQVQPVYNTRNVTCVGQRCQGKNFVWIEKKILKFSWCLTFLFHWPSGTLTVYSPRSIRVQRILCFTKQTFGAIVSSKFFVHSYNAQNSWMCVCVCVCFFDWVYDSSLIILNAIQSNGHDDHFPFFCGTKRNHLNLVFHFFRVCVCALHFAKEKKGEQ